MKTSITPHKPAVKSLAHSLMILGCLTFIVLAPRPAPADTIAVTLAANGPGHFFVDSVEMGPTTLYWTPGTSHTIDAVASPNGSSHMINVWKSWSDGGAVSHTVSPTTNITYTATFVTLNWVGIIAGTGGTVSVSPTNPPGQYSDWYETGTTLTITATPNSENYFSGWTCNFPGQTGTYTGMNNPATVTVYGWFQETASFGIKVTVQTDPPGRTFNVDGYSYNSCQNFGWTPGTPPGNSHTMYVNSPQSDGAGTQYIWTGWSDGGSIYHTVYFTNTTPTTYTAHFKTLNYNHMAGEMTGEGNLRLSYAGDPNGSYVLEHTFQLSPPNWVPLATNNAGSGGLLTFTNTINRDTNCFWRIRAVP